MNIFEEANSKLETFIQKDLNSYHLLRNYDYGIKNRTNVSKISKYTTHRILYEYDIIKKLKIFDKKKKFTDEILWRIYWRGYLENHKSIWNEYKNFNRYLYNSNSLKAAAQGETGIECFDNWIGELKGNNYLHNHSRMWFASIWIFALRLPWQLGASLFMRYLLDGDAASNTLSWRWIAGMHTNKKPYIATKENIKKYTSNRFNNISFNISNKANIIKPIKHQSNDLPTIENKPRSDFLIMFDNDMNIHDRYELFNSYSKVYILFNRHIEHRLELSESVSHFKKEIIANINKLIPNSEIIDSSHLEIFLNCFKTIDVIYPGIGNNLDLLNEFSRQKYININYIYRKDDLMYWSLATSGFYKFKNSFHTI
tara:strand:- start:10613 stop:11719 length:1107 start_codon:yes stop_codon:yes gene_type:complete